MGTGRKQKQKINCNFTYCDRYYILTFLPIKLCKTIIIQALHLLSSRYSTQVQL